MKLPVLLLVAAACATGPVLAQILPPSVSPGALQQQRIDEEERRLQLERLKRNPVTDPIKKDTPEQPAPKASPGDARFLVREIRFTKSEIFSADDLSALARDYAGRELTFADLQILVNRINAAYRDRRVVTAQAVIPPQDISSGVIEIRLVEGHLGDINISGNETTKREYITGRIGLQPGALVDLPSLEQDLLRFNRTNDIQLRAELKPGDTFGTTDLQVNATEPSRHDFRLFADNSGSSTTGENRAGLIYINRSLLGFRDDLYLTVTRAAGQESYSAGYGFPFNTSGGRISLAYYKDYTDIRYGVLSSLDLTGESTTSLLSLRQPVYFGARSQVDLLGTLKKQISKNWISNVFLQETDTENGSIGAELQSADDNGFWIANYNFTAGRSYIFSRDNYTIGRGSVRRNQTLDNNMSAQGYLTFQHSADSFLPASEQKIIGGEGSVRGYPAGIYGGDTGYTLSLELHHPLGKYENGQSTIAANGFFFTDYGYVTPFRPPNSTLRSYEQLSSLGWGVNATIGKRVTARVTLAYALNDLPLEPRRYMVLFQLSASPF